MRTFLTVAILVLLCSLPAAIWVAEEPTLDEKLDTLDELAPVLEPFPGTDGIVPQVREDVKILDELDRRTGLKPMEAEDASAGEVQNGAPAQASPDVEPATGGPAPEPQTHGEPRDHRDFHIDTERIFTGDFESRFEHVA